MNKNYHRNHIDFMRNLNLIKKNENEKKVNYINKHGNTSLIISIKKKYRIK